MALIDMLTDISSFDYQKVGQKHGEYFGEDKATGFTPNRQTKNPTEYIENAITGLGTTDYFDNTHQIGFIAPEFKVSNFTNQKGFEPTTVNYFKDTHQTGLHLYPEFKVSNFVDQKGFEPTAVDYFSNTHQTGLHLYPEFKVSNFGMIPGNLSAVGIFDEPTGTNFFGDENHPGFNLNISHGEDAESHYIIGSGNDFNYPLAHTPRPVVDRFDNIHGTGFTAERINAKLPSEFVGIHTGEPTGIKFTNTGTKYEMGDYNFSGQHSFGLNFGTDIHATGFTAHRTQKDIDTDNKTFAGEYIIGSSQFDKLGFTNYFDILKSFTSGLFIPDMVETDYDKGPGGLFTSLSGLITTQYSRMIDARKGKATNKPKISDFKTDSENTIDGEEGQYHNELRLSDYKGQWKKFGGNAKGLRGANNLGFDEPFIIKEIGDRYDTIGFGMVDGLTDIPFMAVRAIEDLIRITKWTLTPKGIVWNLKQVLLQSQNARKETRIFNPLGALAAVPPLLHTPRHTGGTFIDFKDPPSYPDVTKIKGFFGLGKTGDDEGPVGDRTAMNQADASKPATENTSGGFLGFGAKSNDGDGGKTEVNASDYNLGTGKVKVGTGDKLYSVGVSNQLQVPYGGSESSTKTTDLPKDFIKFRIRDLVNGKWLIFPAHLGTITDTVTPSWSPEKYIGRPDSVHLYSGTDRSVSFDFKVAAFTKQEIPIIQEKMNYLMGLGYPTFKAVLTGDDESRPVAPFIALTIGDLFNNTPGYFSSISITMEENSTWELDEGFQIPQFFSVSVEFVHVGKYLPQTLGKHYEVPWLQDFGTGAGDRGTFTEFKENSRPYTVHSGYDIVTEKINAKQNADYDW